MTIQFFCEPVDAGFIGLLLEEYERQRQERNRRVWAIAPDDPDWPEWLSKEPVFP